MRFWVQTGAPYAVGRGYTVSRVNGRSFYVASNGRCERYLHAEWRSWLGRRLAEGRLFFDGKQLLPPAAGASQGANPVTTPTDIRARDHRFLRAAREVLARYRIERAGEADGVVRFGVRGGARDYVVEVRPDWSAPPTCTCPDARRAGAERGGGYCKHVIATLLSHEELRCQLLDILL